MVITAAILGLTALATFGFGGWLGTRFGKPTTKSGNVYVANQGLTGQNLMSGIGSMLPLLMVVMMMRAKK